MSITVPNIVRAFRKLSSISGSGSNVISLKVSFNIKIVNMQAQDYNIASGFVMREPYFEEVIDEMDVDEDSDTIFGKLILLANDSTVPQEISVIDEMKQECRLEEVENDAENSDIHLSPHQSIGYKAYGPDNIRMFLQTMQEEGRNWNESDGTVISIGCLNKPSKIGGITAQQTEILAELVDKNPCIIIDMAREELCSSFEGLKCLYDGKRCEENITAWKAAGVDFQTNLVCMNVASFNVHQIRSKTWSVKRTPAIVSVPTEKEVNLSIIECMSPFGTISFSKVEPSKPVDVA
ncbi:hypothetical protein INT47_012118 [Mucor saturninus]|uniref:Uncharacterized protein n=1 Tax=Mucor saturninus TaxID=64648 RepID=A0A8H7V014_9FUNG|nr:hypothetical protein INT47_012118 [Mucor saturninus]